MKLSELEKAIILGILARERELQEKFVLPLDASKREATGFIEQQHGLAVGAIGTTHEININSWELSLIVPPPSTDESNVVSLDEHRAAKTQ